MFNLRWPIVLQLAVRKTPLLNVNSDVWTWAAESRLSICLALSAFFLAPQFGFLPSHCSSLDCELHRHLTQPSPSLRSAVLPFCRVAPGRCDEHESSTRRTCQRCCFPSSDTGPQKCDSCRAPTAPSDNHLHQCRHPH